MTDDTTLLREYARCNSEEAFAAMVSRYVNLVYSVAVRNVHDPQLAEEITQAVFIIFARKAKSLSPKTVLSGWLCRTAHYASANALTIQQRRQRREQEAYMQSVLNEPEPEPITWTQIAPFLGRAMVRLGPKDHDAVVLRYFEGKSFQEIGIALGTSENAAKKRVARALEKLRNFFFKYGIASTTSAIAAALSTNSVQAAPVTLAKAATAVALAKGATASLSTSTLIKGALKIMAWSNTKTAIAAGVTVLVVVGTATTLMVHHKDRLKSHAQIYFPRSSWSFVGYATPEDTVQSVFWAMREHTSDSLQVYLNGLIPEMHDKMRQEAQSRGPDAFAQFCAQEMGGVARYRIQKTVMLSDYHAQLRIQFGGGTGPVQTIDMEKIGNEWKFAGISSAEPVPAARAPGAVRKPGSVMVLAIKESLFPAIMKFAEAHGDQLPASLADLKPYFSESSTDMDDDHWKIEAQGKLTPLLSAKNVVFAEQKNVPSDEPRLVIYTDGHVESKRGQGP